MNRLILIMILLGIGIYVYIVLFKNNNYYTNHIQHKNQQAELINDEFIEQPIHEMKHDRHVRFSLLRLMVEGFRV